MFWTQANSAEPEQTPQNAPSDQRLHGKLTGISIWNKIEMKKYTQTPLKLEMGLSNWYGWTSPLSLYGLILCTKLKSIYMYIPITCSETYWAIRWLALTWHSYTPACWGLTSLIMRSHVLLVRDSWVWLIVISSSGENVICPIVSGKSSASFRQTTWRKSPLYSRTFNKLY